MTPRAPSHLRQVLGSPFLLIVALGYSRHWKRVWFIGLWLYQTVLGIDRVQHLDELGT